MNTGICPFDVNSRRNLHRGFREPTHKFGAEEGAEFRWTLRLDREPLAGIGLAELAACRLVLYSRNTPSGRLVAAAFQRAGVAWNASVDIVRAELACALARAGAGVAIVDKFSVGGSGWPGVVVRPLRESISVALNSARSRFDTLSCHVQRFMRVLKEHTRHAMPESRAAAREGSGF